MTPENALVLLPVDLTTIRGERPITRAVTAAIPADKCD